MEGIALLYIFTFFYLWATKNKVWDKKNGTDFDG